MGISRIVSFLPSATELLFALGAENKIVGVTHECNYPEGAKTKPQIINSVFDSNSMNSKEIDEKIIEFTRKGQDIYYIDEKKIVNANPDLIISQDICEVCSAHTNQVKNALRILDNKPQIHTIDPHELDGILTTVLEISEKIGKQQEGTRLVDSLKKRIDFIKNSNFEKIPSVLAIEWLDPFFSSGHWIPQMVNFAGGKNMISSTGEKSKRITLDEISSADPDIIVLMPCGFDVKRTKFEYQSVFDKDKKWNQLRAKKNNKIYAVDANSFFSKPSIRTITGLEILAKIFHPENFQGLEVPRNSFIQI